MRDGWMCRFCWVFVIVGFPHLTILQCSSVHRKVPQRKSRQAVGGQEAGDGIPGVWSSWGPWSPCSSSCGVGVAQQSRRCVALEPEGRGWSLQPGEVYPQLPGRDSDWMPRPGPSLSAVMPSYPLHVGSEPSTFPHHGQTVPLHAQQDPGGSHGRETSNQLSLPLYGDGFGSSLAESRVYRRPANEETAPHQSYGHLSNRGSVPLYRQDPLSNHNRQQLSARQSSASPYRAPSLTNRESAPLYAPEGSSNQGSGSQPRQRSAPYWRGSTGNRRMKQHFGSVNRSRSRSAIRPGLYGYGKVPADFQFREAAAHDRQGHQSNSRPLESRAAWEARPGAEETRRARRGVGAEGKVQGGMTQASAETPQRSVDDPLGWPNQTLLSRQPDREKGVLLKLEGLVPEESAGLGRQLDQQGLAWLRWSPGEVWRYLNDTTGDHDGETFAGADPDVPAFVALSSDHRGRQPRDDSGPRPRARRQVSHLGPGWQVQSRQSRGTGKRAGGRRRGQETPGRTGSDYAVAPRSEPWWQTEASRRASAGESEDRPEPLEHRESRTHPRTLRDSFQLSQGSQQSHHRRLRDEPEDQAATRRRPRRQEYRVMAGPGAGSHRREWDPYPTSSATCPGAETQYKPCSSVACPSGMSDPRREQCAGFNHLQFMGRYYEWEPFTEVRKEQRCELNCRPAGYRFYVRHADRVLDGTPCEANSTDVCVGGRCLAAGCDGTLGSGTRLDKCGVCGGDESACRVVFGTFEDSQVNVGYHKIIEIPSGAKKIKVTEMERSHNYLALRSRSGRSIINGNWAIDRPGKYEAAGTMFMYKRPTESSGESFYAEGPTTESLDVYMIFQQENPGIHYQFIVPVEKPDPPAQNPQPPRQGYGSWTPGNPREVSALGSGPVVAHQGSANTPRVRGGQRDRRLQVYHSSVREDLTRIQPAHRWTSQSSTECSVSCGKGFRYLTFRCVALSTQEVVDDSHCDKAAKPASVEDTCNTHPCPAFWSVGAWAECSRSCGPGTQHRQVLCRQAYANRTVAVHSHRCRHLDKPNATQPCLAQPCTHWQIQTDWESCSVPCGVGQRKRSIRCVSNQGDVVGEAECSGNQKPTDSEACDMGPCVQAWFYTDWGSQCSVECGLGVQRRAVLCLTSNVQDQSPARCEGPRPPDSRACARGQCQRQVRWFTGPWNKCSVECGDGTQNRDLICVIKSGNDVTVTEPSDCAHLEKPASLRACSEGPCGPRWFTAGWSGCSKSCMGGVQKREVRCLGDAGYPSSLCKDTGKPVEQRVCHTHPCMPDLDANCKDSYYNCVVVVQARLCVYPYYKMVCCASCTHAERRSRSHSSRAAGA